MKLETHIPENFNTNDFKIKRENTMADNVLRGGSITYADDFWGWYEMLFVE